MGYNEDKLSLISYTNIARLQNDNSVSAESKDSTELIKEMSLAINMLANEINEDYTETQNDRQRFFVN